MEAFGRSVSCLGGWRQMEQVTGGLIFLVAVVTFLLKVRDPVHLVPSGWHLAGVNAEYC